MSERRVVLHVEWTPEAKRLLRQLEHATETLRRVGRMGLPVVVTTGKGKRRQVVALRKARAHGRRA